MNRPNPKKLQTAVDSWNCNNQIGAPIYYRNDLGKITETTTRTDASVLGGHTAVIWLDGVSGCVSLDRVQPREAAQALIEMGIINPTGNEKYAAAAQALKEAVANCRIADFEAKIAEASRHKYICKDCGKTPQDIGWCEQCGYNRNYTKTPDFDQQ